MAQKRITTKTTKKSPKTTKTVKVRGGLKSTNKFDWKRALPIIVLLAVVGGALVYQSFAVAPEATTSQNGMTLRTIYADQIKPNGMTSNPYLRESIYTDFKTVPIKPLYSQTLQRWESSWPEKIKVCAILYNERPGIGPGVETTVSLNVLAVGTYKKSQILEKLPALPNKLYPKYEVCSDAISKTYTSPAAPGRPAFSIGKSDSFGIHMDMVSIVRKDPTKPHLPAQVLKQYQWDTTPNDYYVRVEQYIIKNAENNDVVQNQNATPSQNTPTPTNVPSDDANGSQSATTPEPTNVPSDDVNRETAPNYNESTGDTQESGVETSPSYASGEEAENTRNMPSSEESGMKSKRWWPW